MNLNQTADGGLMTQDEAERRIAACVNAFEGIPTDRIEGKNLGEILAGEVRLNGAGPRADGGFGFEFSGGACQLMAEAYAEQFRQSGAINYLELLFHHSDIGPLTITMQRVEGLTPAQKLAQAEAQRDALAAENAALKSERAQMAEIGELIRTQDNRITDQPFFAVMAKREMVGSEDHDYDRICWVENQSGDYVEATETQHRRLEAIYQGKYEVREGWDRYAMKEIDVFVTGCFTEQGCKDYINRNSHNLNKPFIYAFGSYRNNEYQAVRKFIMDIPETPATDAYLNSVRAEGVDYVAEAIGAKCAELKVGSKDWKALKSIVFTLGDFAAQLRAGKDGE